MRKRFPIIILLLLLLLSCFYGCDSGLKYKEMMVYTLPDKTEYVAGERDSLDFSGGSVLLTTVDGTTRIREMQEYTYHREGFSGKGMYISTDVNLQVPGTYTVTVWQTKEMYCQFSVTVISKAG